MDNFTDQEIIGMLSCFVSICCPITEISVFFCCLGVGLLLHARHTRSKRGY